MAQHSCPLSSQKILISCIINADNRIHSDADITQVGDFGLGSLQGCRSYDFLLDGPKMVSQFFSGHHHQIILFVDLHEVVPQPIEDELQEMLKHGVIHKLIYHPHNGAERRFNDLLYLRALQYATGEFTVHLDQDAILYRDPNYDAVGQMKEWLKEVKYVCQPSMMEDHGMKHASTRFFMCRTESLDLPELTRMLDDNYRSRNFEGKHLPCLESFIGALAGEGQVLYPPAHWENYIIASWARYKKGVLRWLNGYPYEEVRKYLVDECGIRGVNDILAK